MAREWRIYRVDATRRRAALFVSRQRSRTAASLDACLGDLTRISWLDRMTCPAAYFAPGPAPTRSSRCARVHLILWSTRCFLSIAPCSRGLRRSLMRRRVALKNDVLHALLYQGKGLWVWEDMEHLLADGFERHLADLPSG